MLKYISYHLDKGITAYRLGIMSILRVLIYKVGVRYRLHEVVRIDSDHASSDELIGDHIPQGYSFDHFWFFNKKGVELFLGSQQQLSKTLFLTNWFNGYVHSNSRRWFEIVDFDPNAGDIKGVWELSRWYWAIEIATDMTLSLQYKRDLLDGFVKLWVYQNPYLHGPNWKCGQEASLRLIHFLVAMRLLGYGPNDLSPAQRQLVIKHLRRIQPTLSYAKGQKNNHWISEAVGLVIGGLWLEGDSSSEKYYKRGIRELGEALEALFNDDGSFAQSSFNYLRHALTLVAISRLEIFRSGRECRIFESTKLKNALRLFDHFCDSSSTTTHNWGANDGSNPLAISKSEFLDPSAHKCFYDYCFKGIYSDTANFVVGSLMKTYDLGIELPTKSSCFESGKIDSAVHKNGFTEFPDGGLVFYRNSNYRILVRLPKFNFKPSQDDVGHIDVIHNGKGVLLDGGTYSYFTDDDMFSYFQGVMSHNTLYRTSEKYSMSKLSRFVFGSWTKGSWTIVNEDKLVIRFKNVFSDYLERTLNFEVDRISVCDRAIGSDKSNFVSGITVNCNSLNVSSETFGERITTKAEIQNPEKLTILSNCRSVISDVPVSFCYGDKVSRKRLEFQMNSKEVKFEIRFEE